MGVLGARVIERLFARPLSKAKGARVMRALEDLVAEHRGIERMLAILDSISGRLETGLAVDVNHLEEILEFLQVFADRCHHAKEEDLLFVAMEQAGVANAGGPIGAMLVDHEEGRRHIRAMAEGIEAYRRGEDDAGPRIASHARGYATLLREHIVKEDRVLYPLANRVLTQEKLHELEEGFEVIERDVVGEGRHEAFHELLDTLEDVYR